MIKFGIAAILSSFLALESQAWAPSSSFTTKNVAVRKHIVSLRQPQHHKPLVSLYASVAEDVTEDDQQKKTKPQKRSQSSQGRRFDDPVPYSELTIGVMKETFPGENRVSQTPDSVANLVKAGLTVIVEQGGM
jgi:hypothetical protein